MLILGIISRLLLILIFSWIAIAACLTLIDPFLFFSSNLYLGYISKVKIKILIESCWFTSGLSSIGFLLYLIKDIFKYTHSHE